MGNKRSVARRARSGGGVAQAIAGVFRSGGALGEAVLGLHRAIAKFPHEELTSQRAEQFAKAFPIDEENFADALSLELRHLRQLQSLLINRSAVIDNNYLKIVTEFIIANGEKVDRLLHFDAIATRFSFEGHAQSIKDAMLASIKIDQQSMMMMKLYAALHSYSDDLIREYLEENMRSTWTRSSLIYPILYYFSSLPNQASIDKMLLHFIPKSKECKTERSVIKFLLQPEEDWTGGLAFRSYLGLLSHPHDALEYIVSDLEIKTAKGTPLDETYLACFRRLAERFPQHRLRVSLQVAEGRTLKAASPKAIVAQLSGGSESKQFELLESVLRLDLDESTAVAPASPMMEALVAVRRKRYPTQSEFDELNAYRQRFYVLSGAKVVDAVTRSMYLYLRDPPERERLALIRSVVAFGGVSELVWLAPGGYLAARSGMFAVPGAEISSNHTSALANELATRDDRTWIMGANWIATKMQLAGKIGAWAEFARQTFPVWVHPRYLSGLDWHWLSEAEKSTGVYQYCGNPDYVYVLFLRLLEHFLRESVSLRIVVEPVAREFGLEGFPDWLEDQFGVASLGFVRIFLTPETILKLRLAGNYTAALTTRIVLLEDGIRRFHFQSALLSEEDLAQEQSALTATLSRMSVGARQFEIPWATLKVDANARNRDTFSTHLAMSFVGADADTISATRRSTTYPFANGSSVEYEASNRDLSLIFVLGGIVDTFLTHPSAGLESILSVRIRHDSFRREFSYALSDVQSKEISGLSPGRISTISKEVEQGVNREIQAWLDARMHTRRKDKPLAIFDIIPSKAQMTALIEAARPLGTLDEMIELVFGWLAPRLEELLADARTSLSAALLPAVVRKIDEVSSKFGGRARDEEEVTLVTQAIKSTLQRRVAEIQEWFKVPEEDRLHSLRVAEILQAVEQRFWPEVSAGRVSLDRGRGAIEDRIVQPHQIRPLYDLLSEATRNALKHSGLERTRVRLRCHSEGEHDSVSISSLCALGTKLERALEGHPYESLNEALFAEGRSGLEKIVYLSAYLTGGKTQMKVERRDRSFHVILPLSSFGQSPSSEDVQ